MASAGLRRCQQGLAALAGACFVVPKRVSADGPRPRSCGCGESPLVALRGTRSRQAELRPSTRRQISGESQAPSRPPQPALPARAAHFALLGGRSTCPLGKSPTQAGRANPYTTSPENGGAACSSRKSLCLGSVGRTGEGETGASGVLERSRVRVLESAWFWTVWRSTSS